MEDRSQRRADGAVPIWRHARQGGPAGDRSSAWFPPPISWLGALSRPRNIGIGVATVEWVRAHGGNPLVSEVEALDHTLNRAREGWPGLLKRWPRSAPPTSPPKNEAVSLRRLPVDRRSKRSSSPA